MADDQQEQCGGRNSMNIDPAPRNPVNNVFYVTLMLPVVVSLFLDGNWRRLSGQWRQYQFALALVVVMLASTMLNGADAGEIGKKLKKDQKLTCTAVAAGSPTVYAGG